MRTEQSAMFLMFQDIYYHLTITKITDYVSSVGIYLKDLYSCMYTELSVKLWNKLLQIIEEIGSVFEINPTNLLQIHRIENFLIVQLSIECFPRKQQTHILINF